MPSNPYDPRPALPLSEIVRRFPEDRRAQRRLAKAKREAHEDNVVREVVRGVEQMRATTEAMRSLIEVMEQTQQQRANVATLLQTLQVGRRLRVARDADDRILGFVG